MEKRELNTVLERIGELLLEKNRTQTELCEYLGLRKDVYTKWKQGHLKSYLMYISEIADYFDVSADYILCRTNDDITSKRLTASETKLLSQFRALDGEQQTWFLQGIRFIDSKNTNK